MKTIFNKTILVVALLSIVMLGCKKKEADPEPEPTPTPTPTYNITYKVDGTLIQCSDGKGAADGWFTISGKDAANPTIRAINLRIPSYDLLKDTIYVMAQYPQYPKASAQYIDYLITEGEFESVDGGPATDNITVTKFDKPNKKISGTFNFTLVNKDGATKVITEGTFTDLTW